MKSLIVSSEPQPKSSLWLGIAVSLSGTIAYAAGGTWFMSIMCLILLVELVLSLTRGTARELEADAEIIRYSIGIRCWEMKWSDVTKIETSGSGIMVLHSHNRRLTLPSPTMWPSEGKEQMLKFIQSQAQAWNIPQGQTRRASWQGCKNTRVTLPKRPKPPLSL